MFDDQMLQCIFSSGGRAAHLFSLCGIGALFLRFEIDFVILCFSNALSNIWQRCLYNDGRLFFLSHCLKDTSCPRLPHLFLFPRLRKCYERSRAMCLRLTSLYAVKLHFPWQ